ncbi:fasciclin-1-like [Agrilus planipennis]|uniref:Fasciclin-1-like n=1 Tax=Agrilus planipennis TaxID=224129 RepID=A0A7F5QZB6_AGRPL|nr:fasciclin-1-like [Agrilus planipennis]
MKRVSFYVLSVIILVISSPVSGRRLTVTSKIGQDPDLSHFYCTIEKNVIITSYLAYSEVTVFAPVNSAFANRTTADDSDDVLFYHFGWHSKNVGELNSEFVYTISDKHPPLWITNQERAVFVNNAKIVMGKSNYMATARNGATQVLHVVDDVLDPVVRGTSLLSKPPKASDFFEKNVLWNIGPHKVDLFWEKVVLLRKESLYRVDRSGTFFVPVDDGFTEHRLQMLDADVIDAHIIPNYVFFTRPTPKNFPFETLADGKMLFVLIYFMEQGGKIFVKANTVVGNSKHPIGEMIVEVVKPNIPVRNGVVHLIKRPLVVSDKRLSFFPYLPVIHKLTSDPFLDISFTLFEKTRLLQYLDVDQQDQKFTLFVPRDRAWRGLITSSTDLSGNLFHKMKNVMGRHIVVSNLEYSMERLKSLSQSENRTDIDLMSMSGDEIISIRKERNNYYIIRGEINIKVYRADYECTNGIIHIIDHPFIDLNEELI